MGDIEYIWETDKGTWKTTGVDGIAKEAGSVDEKLDLLANKINQMVKFVKELEEEVGEELFDDLLS